MTNTKRDLPIYSNNIKLIKNIEIIYSIVTNRSLIIINFIQLIIKSMFDIVVKLFEN